MPTRQSRRSRLRSLFERIHVARVQVSTRLLVVAFLFGLAIRVLSLPMLGTSDVQTFKVWAIYASSGSVFAAYAPPEASAEPIPEYVRLDYPPLGIAVLAGMGAVVGATPEDIDRRALALTVAVKALPVLAQLAVFWMVAAFVFRHTRNATTALAAAMAFWLNPALVLNGPVLGYLDPLCYAVGLAAIVAAATDRIRLAAVLGVCSALIKPQGVFFLVPVAAAAWTSRRVLVRMILSAATTAIVVITPFVVGSGPAAFLRAMRVNMVEDTLSGNALNLWWIITAALRMIDRGPEILVERVRWLSESRVAAALGFLPRPFMAAVVIALSAWIGWRVRGTRSLPLLAACGALVIHVYFSLAINVHENHLVDAVVLLCVAAAWEKSYQPLLLGVSVLCLLNMLLFYGVGRTLPQPPRIGLITVPLAIGNMALLYMHAKAFIALQTRSAPRPSISA